MIASGRPYWDSVALAISSGWQEVRYSCPFEGHYNIVPRGAQVRRQPPGFGRFFHALWARLSTLDAGPGKKARRLTADLTCDTKEQPSLEPSMQHVRFVPSGRTCRLARAPSKIRSGSSAVELADTR